MSKTWQERIVTANPPYVDPEEINKAMLEEINELRADAARLDWLSDQAEAHNWRMAGPYATLREAVDAAMKGKS